MQQDAVIRKRQVIGEAVKNLYDATTSAHTDVPWWRAGNRGMGRSDRVRTARSFRILSGSTPFRASCARIRTGC